jgi:hypothetical protein
VYLKSDDTILVPTFSNGLELQLDGGWFLVVPEELLGWILLRVKYVGDQNKARGPEPQFCILPLLEIAYRSPPPIDSLGGERFVLPWPTRPRP